MSAQDIIREAKSLDKRQRQCLLAFLVARNVAITECSDGSRVNLDKLDSLLLFHIEQLITLLKYGQQVDGDTERVVSEGEVDAGQSEGVVEEE